MGPPARGRGPWGAAGLAAGAGFGLAAASVAAAGAAGGPAAGPLGALDAGVNAAVAGGLGAEFVRGPVPRVLSDAPLAGCLAGSVGAAAAALLRGGEGARRVRAQVVACSLVAAAGASPGAPLSNALKELFQRTRPSELYSSYAFPSGHSLAAAFLAGTFFCVLLPLALEEEGPPGEAPAGYPHPRGWQLAAWAATVATVGSGRLLMDVHWLTDVLGGGSLGTGLVALEVAVGRGLAAGLARDAAEEGR